MEPHAKIKESRPTHSSKIALVANGSIQDYSLISSLIQSYEYIVAVDGGLIHCQKMGIVPHLLIGDFDSITPGLLQQYSDIPLIHYPTDKDDTDLELAVKAVEHPDLKTMGVFGAMGLRVDHTINNLYLLSLHSRIIIETETESIFLVRGENLLNCCQGQTLSLLPLGLPAHGVSSEGLKWELNNATLNTHFKSISNICLKEMVSIKINQGELICCLNRM